MKHKQIIHSALRPAINHWFHAQTADIYGKFFLFVRKVREGEKVAAPVIAKSAPNDDYFKAMEQPLSIGWTIEQAHYQCYEALQNAPILGN